MNPHHLTTEKALHKNTLSPSHLSKVILLILAGGFPMELITRTIELNEFAQGLAREAGNELMKYFNNSTRAKITRSGSNPQTVADVISNDLIRKEISQRFPDHDIKSEETYDHAPFYWDYKSNYVWLVDPCDGTMNFISNIPYHLNNSGEAIG